MHAVFYNELSRGEFAICQKIVCRLVFGPFPEILAKAPRKVKSGCWEASSLSILPERAWARDEDAGWLVNAMRGFVPRGSARR